MSAAAYEIDGVRLDADSADLFDALAAAHIAHARPHCLCNEGRPQMYVARLGEGFIVKRMPNTGSQHAPGCPSYEAPADLSGLGQVLGSAIREDPATGLVSLRLGFPMAKVGRRSNFPTATGDDSSVVSDRTKLSLRGLLHYLWDQAELTRWQPGFAGKRSWATVRKHLLQAAENKLVAGQPLLDRLYVPETFSVDRREQINRRQLARWSRCGTRPGPPKQLLLMIAEVKELVPARYGFKAVIKHVPDHGFAVDPVLHRRMARRFEASLSLWAASDNLHMIIVATFDFSDGGVPTIGELSLMPATREWVPIEDRFELDLVEALVGRGRTFLKMLRYNAPAGAGMASAVLVDTGDHPFPLFIIEPNASKQREPTQIGCSPVPWTWNVGAASMPALPGLAVRTTAARRR